MQLSNLILVGGDERGIIADENPFHDLARFSLDPFQLIPDRLDALLALAASVLPQPLQHVFGHEEQPFSWSQALKNLFEGAFDLVLAD